MQHTMSHYQIPYFHFHNVFLATLSAIGLNLNTINTLDTKYCNNSVKSQSNPNYYCSQNNKTANFLPNSSNLYCSPIIHQTTALYLLSKLSQQHYLNISQMLWMLKILCKNCIVENSGKKPTTQRVPYKIYK